MIVDEDTVLGINEAICEDQGTESVVLSRENLLSALGIQQWYQDKELQASALLRSLILNHPFQDGNKRTAYVAAMMVATINRDDNEVERCLLEIARGNLKDVNDIASILYNTEP